MSLVAESRPAPVFVYDRPLTEDERALNNHVLMFGSDGYPVRKVGSRHWSWSYRSLSSKLVFPTKRAAVESFEKYLEVIRSCLRAEAYRAAKAERDRQSEMLSYGIRCDYCGEWKTACTCET